MTDNFKALQEQAGFTHDELLQLTRNAFTVAWLDDEARAAYLAEIDAFAAAHAA